MMIKNIYIPGVAVGIALIIFSIWAIAPLILLWCLNTLGASIPYTFWTWLAGMILILFVHGGIVTKVKE